MKTTDEKTVEIAETHAKDLLAKLANEGCTIPSDCGSLDITASRILRAFDYIHILRSKSSCQEQEPQLQYWFVIASYTPYCCKPVIYNTVIEGSLVDFVTLNNQNAQSVHNSFALTQAHRINKAEFDKLIPQRSNGWYIKFSDDIKGGYDEES